MGPSETLPDRGPPVAFMCVLGRGIVRDPCKSRCELEFFFMKWMSAHEAREQHQRNNSMARQNLTMLKIVCLSTSLSRLSPTTDLISMAKKFFEKSDDFVYFYSCKRAPRYLHHTSAFNRVVSSILDYMSGLLLADAK